MQEEMCRCWQRIDKAIESLKLKQIRYVNESDYVLDDGDLQEEINILQNGSDSQ